MNFTLQTYNEKRRLEFQDIAEIYESIGWQAADTFDLEKLERSFKNTSDVGLAIGDGNECIGFSRTFSDQLYITYIMEIVILKQYQRMGVGQALMDRIFRKFGNTDIYTDALKGSQEFFVKNGLTTRPSLTACSRAARKDELEGAH